MATVEERKEQGATLLTVDGLHSSIDRITYPDTEVNPDYVKGSDDFNIVVIDAVTGEEHAVDQVWVNVPNRKLEFVVKSD